jgi:hypothetical protein
LTMLGNHDNFQDNNRDSLSFPRTIMLDRRRMSIAPTGALSLREFYPTGERCCRP